MAERSLFTTTLQDEPQHIALTGSAPVLQNGDELRGMQFASAEVNINPDLWQLKSRDLLLAVYASVGLTNQHISAISDLSMRTVSRTLGEVYDTCYGGYGPGTNARTKLAGFLLQSQVCTVKRPLEPFPAKWRYLPIARLVAAGKTDAAIAQELGYAKKSVKTYVAAAAIEAHWQGREQLAMAVLLGGQA